MSYLKSGGPAFPLAPYTAKRSDNAERWEELVEQPGMSLRDYFAGQALKGAADSICDEMSPEHPSGMPDVLDHAARHAMAAYILADAMIRAREAK